MISPRSWGVASPRTRLQFVYDMDFDLRYWLCGRHHAKLASSQCSSVGLMLCCSMWIVFLSVVLCLLCPFFRAIDCSFVLICIRSDAILLSGLRHEAKKLVSDGVLWKTSEGRFCRHGCNEGHY